MRTKSTRYVRIALVLLPVLLPPIMEAAEPKLTDAGLRKRVEEMFHVGYVRGPEATKASLQLYESLRKDAASDPRIEYSYGLVLLRQLNHKQATAEFLATTRRPGTPYWPAWKALIWAQFIAKDHSAGYAKLLEFAALVKESNDFSDVARHEECHWMGRIMAAVELMLESKLSQETWSQSEKKLLKLLNPELIHSYNSGKEEMKLRQSLLDEDHRQAQEAAKEHEIQVLEKREELTGKSLDAADEKRSTLKNSVAEIKDSFAQATITYDKQMARLERDYGMLERRATTIVTAMSNIDQEINLIQMRLVNQATNIKHKDKEKDRTMNPQQLDQAISQLLIQRQSYDLELQTVFAGALQVSSNAQKLVGVRAQSLEQYRKATGDIVQSSKALDQWKERFQKQASSLKKTKEHLKAPAGQIKSKQAKSFRNYIDLDLFSERDKVLASYGSNPISK